MEFRVYYLTIGFMGLVASMMVFFASYTERRFYELLSLVYERWHSQMRELSIGTVEYKRRMEAVEKILPDTKGLRRTLNITSVAIVTGLALYCYGLLAAYKGWRDVEFLSRLFVASAFLFIFSGLSSYHVNRKLLGSTRRLSSYLRSIQHEG